MRLALLFLLSCAKSAPTTPPVVPATVADASTSIDASPSSTPVGLAAFDVPPANAVAKNDRGVSLLSKGNTKEAIADLEAALALAPTFTMARYNLACAHARAGDFDRARADLEAVYDEDFIAIRDHASKDEDLTEFWKSARGKDLASRIPTWEARFQRVLDRGVRSILWRAGTGPRGALKTSLLRIGVYDPETNRFVAIAPPNRKAYTGFTSSMVPYAIYATGNVRDMLGGDLDAGMTMSGIEVYPISTAGVPIATVDVNVDTLSALVTLGNDGLTLHTWTAATIPSGASFDLAFGSKVTKKTYNGPQPPLKTSASRPVLMDLGYNHWGYWVHENDVSWKYKPHELTTPKGVTIPIPKNLAFYQASPRIIPNGDKAVLLWNATTLHCDPNHDVPGHFKMALVDGTNVTSLGEGDGAAHATWTKSGDLYVQRGMRVYGKTELPEGVLLVPPLTRDDECGF